MQNPNLVLITCRVGDSARDSGSIPEICLECIRTGEYRCIRMSILSYDWQPAIIDGVSFFVATAVALSIDENWPERNRLFGSRDVFFRQAEPPTKNVSFPGLIGGLDETYRFLRVDRYPCDAKGQFGPRGLPPGPVQSS